VYMIQEHVSRLGASARLRLQARDMQIASYGLGAEIPRLSGIPVIIYFGKKGCPAPDIPETARWYWVKEKLWFGEKACSC
jgi:hypothetical protein